MESRIQDIINSSFSFIDKENDFTDNTMKTLYKKRDKLKTKIIKKRKDFEIYANNDKSLRNILKHIYKNSKFTTYENLEQKLITYANNNNITYEYLLEHMEFKGYIDQGKNNTDGITSENNFSRNERELILEKVKLLMNQNTKYYCFCNDHSKGNGLRYLNIFKINENYFIIGSHCIIEIVLLIEEQSFKKEIRDNLAKMENSMTKCLDTKVILLLKDEFNTLLRELHEIRTEIETKYNELRLKQQQLEQIEEESRRQRRQIKYQEYERLLKESEEREKQRIEEFRRIKKEEEEIEKKKKEEQRKQEEKIEMFNKRIKKEEKEPQKEYEKELEIEYQQNKKEVIKKNLYYKLHSSIVKEEKITKEDINKVNNILDKDDINYLINLIIRTKKIKEEREQERLEREEEIKEKRERNLKRRTYERDQVNNWKECKKDPKKGGVISLDLYLRHNLN